MEGGTEGVTRDGIVTRAGSFLGLETIRGKQRQALRSPLSSLTCLVPRDLPREQF